MGFIMNPPLSNSSVHLSAPSELQLQTVATLTREPPNSWWRRRPRPWRSSDPPPPPPTPSRPPPPRPGLRRRPTSWTCSAWLRRSTRLRPRPRLSLNNQQLRQPAMICSNLPGTLLRTCWMVRIYHFLVIWGKTDDIFISSRGSSTKLIISSNVPEQPSSGWVISSELNTQTELLACSQLDLITNYLLQSIGQFR